MYTTKEEIDAEIQIAKNAAFSYYNTNSVAIQNQEIRASEGNQIILQKLLIEEFKRGSRPLRIVFLVPDISLWDVYEPIYREMENSDAFEPIVVAFDRVDIKGDKQADEVELFFQNKNIECNYASEENGFYPPLHSHSPDIIFYTLGTTAYPEAYRLEFTSRFCLTCYLSYGFLMVNQFEYQFGQHFHHLAWKLYASTEREVIEYSARSKRLTPNIELVGYPKFDLYKNVTRQEPPRKTVIWAPHWTIGVIYPDLNLGTFSDICNDMVVFMTERSEIDFIFRPHPNLRYACEATTFMPNAVYDGYIDQLEDIPNVSLAKDGDNVAKFLNSSAMITDSVSFLAEYLPSKNPLLFLDRKDRAKFSDTGENIIKAHYSGLGMDSITEFIDQVVINGNDEKIQNRNAAIRNELNIGETGATQQIIQGLLSAIAPDREI